MRSWLAYFTVLTATAVVEWMTLAKDEKRWAERIEWKLELVPGSYKRRDGIGTEHPVGLHHPPPPLSTQPPGGVPLILTR
jgi:hypothetical protein